MKKYVIIKTHNINNQKLKDNFKNDYEIMNILRPGFNLDVLRNTIKFIKDKNSIPVFFVNDIILINK